MATLVESCEHVRPKRALIWGCVGVDSERTVLVRIILVKWYLRIWRQDQSLADSQYGSRIPFGIPERVSTRVVYGIWAKR